MRLTKKLMYPAIIALCISTYQTSSARDWDRGSNNYTGDTHWDGYRNNTKQESPVYNSEITYNAFPREAKVVGRANYTIRGRYNDNPSERLVNIGEKIQEKKNETVQRYDKKVSTIIDNEVEKTLDKIEGSIDSPVHGYSHLSAHPHGGGDHHGVIASQVVPAHSAHTYHVKRKKSSVYLGGSFNYGIFHGVSHIRNGLGTSALIGLTALDTNVSAEFGFNYNRYNLGHYYGVPQNYRANHSYMNNINHLEEYSGSINVRYHLLHSSALRPSFGLVASYRYRTYAPNTYRYDNYTSVDAIDCGFSAGLDFVISDRLSFGVDYKYMLNLHNAVDGFYQDDLYGRKYFGLDNTENLNYMLFNFTTRLFF